MNIKRVQHVSIPISAGGAEKARWFYTGVLGIPEKPVPVELDASKLTWFAAGSDEHEIHCFVDSDYENRSSGAHLCLEVDSINELRSRLVDNGITIDETISIHNRPRCFARDPFGNQIEFAQIVGPYQEVKGA